MKTRTLLTYVLVLIFPLVLGGVVATTVATAREGVGDERPARALASTQKSAQTGQAIIVDHSTIDINAVPQYWIEEAKRTLHIAYGHTSHGSQLTSGMTGLIGFANGGGKGLLLPQDIFAWNNGGTGGALDLHDGAMGGDVGYYPQWVDNTRGYLGAPDPITGRGTSQPDVNVIMWSWCGQASGRTEETMLSTYLTPMSELEAEYPGVTFVYMTGHADGSSEEGNLHLRNQQIRQYSIQNNKVLFDFYDIELYDPDGNYYGDRYVLDTCYYDGNGDGNPRNDSTNWAIDWSSAHTQDIDWYSCGCAHSEALNCNQKAYAVWWLWARLAGWEGVSAGSQKSASAETVMHGQPLTYTVVIRDLTAPLTTTVYLTDVVPTGLTYIPGTLDATAGAVDDGDAPTLRWSGTLTPTPIVTITYVADATYGAGGTGIFPRVVTNTATIAAPGYETLSRTATVIITSSPDLPDLSASYKTASTAFADYGERVTYSIGIRNTGKLLSETVVLNDVLPDGQIYVPDSLDATSGEAGTALLPVLSWSGVLSSTPAVTLTYAVTIAQIGGTGLLPRIDVNSATIAIEGHSPITPFARLLIGWPRLYLPLVIRNQ